MTSSDREWLTVSEAAAVLGVGAATVRRWTAAGRLKAFVTPGGHRRYDTHEVHRLVGSHGRRRTTMSAEELGALWLARESNAVVKARTEHWYAAFSEEEKAAARSMGHDLVRLAARYVAEPPQRMSVMNEVTPLAAAYGQHAVRAGVSLGDMLDALGHFRRPLYSVVTKSESESGEELEPAIRVVALAEFLDRFTLAMVEAFVASALSNLTSRGPSVHRP